MGSWFWMLCLWIAWVPVARAEVPDPPADAALIARPELPENKKKAEREEAISEAEAQAERKRREKLARVIVLQPAGAKVDYQDPTIQRNVRSRIARPDAQFFPEVDLYQNGRKVRDRTVVPAMQPAVVPEQNVERVRDAVDEVAAIPWSAMSPERWGRKAQELREMVELLWFVDRVELREPLFLLYAQIGRAAENEDQIRPPFFEEIGRTNVNYYYFLAAQLALQDPSLMNKLTDQDVHGSVQYLLQQLDQGAFPGLTIDFEQDNQFDADAFAKDYEVYLNGIVTEPSDAGQIDIFYGRTDIYLKRKDSGHGLSERLEVTKLDDKIYFVRDVARKKMGLDFIDQLLLHPNECTPSVDDDILNYIAIYAKIHEKAEIYIAVPENGNPNKIRLWRYDRPTATLQLVGGGASDFPVRFAVLAQVGLLFNGATPTFDTSISTPGSAEGALGSLNPVDRFDPGLNPAMVPLDLELRIHYSRLMVAVGAEAGFNTGGSTWAETYRTPGNPDALVVDSLRQPVPANGRGLPDNPDGIDISEGNVLYHELKVNRNLYLGPHVVLGRDAGIGFGPRLGVRVGWTNVPYALQTTAHAGWTLPAPGIKSRLDRVRPLVDVDARFGASWPFKPSLAHVDKVSAYPVFGLTAGVGSTF